MILRALVVSLPMLAPAVYAASAQSHAYDVAPELAVTCTDAGAVYDPTDPFRVQPGLQSQTLPIVPGSAGNRLGAAPTRLRQRAPTAAIRIAPMRPPHETPRADGLRQRTGFLSLRSATPPPHHA